MESIVSSLASILNVSNYDIYFIGIFIVLIVFFLILGITKIYEILFGMILGISIFIVLQFLLIQTQCQVNFYVPDFINQNIAKFIVSSSIYLIFILSILIPLNGLLNIPKERNLLVKIFSTILLSFALSVFYVSTIIGFIEKIYIFNVDNVFMFMAKLSFWQDFIQSSKIYQFILPQVPLITIIGIGFVIYKLVFSDVINIILISLLITIKALFKKRDNGGGDGQDSGLGDGEVSGSGGNGGGKH